VKRPVTIALVVLAAYILTAGGHLYTSDGEVLFRVTRSLVRGQGLAIEPLPGHEATRPAAPPRPDGREYAQYGIGQPILAMPLCWLGMKLGRLGADSAWQRMYGRPGLTPGRVGYPATAAELAPRWAVSWFNVFIGALLALMAWLVAREITHSDYAAGWTSLLYGLGTMAWPHSRTYFTEPLATLCIAAAWYCLLRAMRGRHIAAWCAAAGAAAGYAALVRLDSILAYPALALLLYWPIARAGRDALASTRRAWIAFCIPAALCGVAILCLNYLHFHSVLATGYEDQPEGIRFTPLLAGLFGLLFSIGRGLIFFSPVLVVGLWGWRPLAEATRSRHRALVWAIALAVLAPLLFHAKWQNWAGGWCWGPRHIFMIHFYLALPVAAWLATAAGHVRRIVPPVVLALGMIVQLIGCSQDFFAFYDRYFRVPGQAFLIQYDPEDQEYWSRYFQMHIRRGPDESWRPLPLVAPVPIQYSLYDPQLSIWAGYSRMTAAGELDNFWINLIRGPQSVPAGGAP
jgi:hypothetical protein